MALLVDWESLEKFMMYWSVLGDGRVVPIVLRVLVSW